MSRGIISTSNLGVIPGPGDKHEHAVRARARLVQGIDDDPVSGLEAFCGIPELACKASEGRKYLAKIGWFVCQFLVFHIVFHSFTS